MRNLKRCFNFTSIHDSCMTLPRQYCHGKFFKKSSGIAGKHDSMTVFLGNSLIRVYACARIYTYYHISIFLKNNYKETLKKSAMTLSKKSIMQVSWRCHGVMAESLLAVALHLFLVSLLAWRVSGGAAC